MMARRVWNWCKRNKGKILFALWAIPMIHYGSTKAKMVIIITPMGDGMYSTRALTIEKDTQETEANSDENENR